MNGLATPVAFQRITISTGAAAAPLMNEFLEFLLSQWGDRLRSYIREIDVIESLVHQGRFKGYLIEELVMRLDRLLVFR